jgi:hypothetical protein
MDDREVLFHEYNNLWNEKLVHKQSIRKFHNYLTYITAIGSLAMAFHGVSASDFFKVPVDPAMTNHILKNAGSIVQLFFIAFTPVVLITLTFPLNDIYHIYVMGHQIGELEKKINAESGKKSLLTWEHLVCPVVYGGQKVKVGQIETKLTNTIALGDFLLLAPVLALICLFSTVASSVYICQKLGCLYTVAYVLVIAYMVAIVVVLGSKVKHYTGANGPIAGIVAAKHALTEGAEHETER